jgi:hypothetical protein
MDSYEVLQFTKLVNALYLSLNLRGALAIAEFPLGVHARLFN